MKRDATNVPNATSVPNATIRCGAVVIGSGAGGAPVALALAEAGFEVVVLESGARFETRDFSGEEGEMIARLMTANTARDSGMEVYAGACVGGSTVVNDALCWRPPPEVLESWRRDFGLPGLSDAAFAPYVDRAWRTVNASPTDREHLNRNAHHLEVGAARLGWSAEAMHRNVRGCANLGLCNIGCPSGAKQSALVTWIPDAEARGARVVPLARADRIEVEGGRVRAVTATRFDPKTRAPIGALRVEADIVCVAAGVLGTPALLLRSGLGSDTALGRGIQFHSSVYVTARFREPVLGFYGPTMAYAVTEWSDVNGRRGPGYMLENVTVSPSVTASSLPGFGAEHERVMEALPHLARAVVVLRDRTRGSVAIDGDRLPALSYQPVADDLARIRDAVKQLTRLYLAAGATEVYLPVNGVAPVRSETDLAALDAVIFEPRILSLLYAVHLFGGAAMGASRAQGFCDEAGRAFDVDGLYVTDAAALPSNTGANPQITIMANALRIAAGIRNRPALW
jgi:choline dehydrogenase-like flavoprotein